VLVAAAVVLEGSAERSTRAVCSSVIEASAPPINIMSAMPWSLSGNASCNTWFASMNGYSIKPTPSTCQMPSGLARDRLAAREHTDTMIQSVKYT